MASKYLVEGATDLSLSASWSSSKGGAGGAGAPANDDDLFLLDVDWTVTTGLDLSGVQLGSLTLTLGTSGVIDGPLILDANGTTGVSDYSNGTVAIRGNTASTIHLQSGSGSSDDINQLNIRNANVRLGSGDYAVVRTVDSNVVVTGDADPASFTQYGGTTLYNGGTDNVAHGLNGGTLEIRDRPWETLSIFEGRLRTYGTATGSGSGDTLFLYAGTLANIASDATISTLTIDQGAEINDTNNPYEITVTNSTMRGSASLFPNATTKITYTNATAYQPIRPVTA